MNLFSVSDATKAKIIMINTVLQHLSKAGALIVKILMDNKVTLEEAVEFAGTVGADFLPQK